MAEQATTLGNLYSCFHYVRTGTFGFCEKMATTHYSMLCHYTGLVLAFKTRKAGENSILLTGQEFSCVWDIK